MTQEMVRDGGHDTKRWLETLGITKEMADMTQEIYTRKIFSWIFGAALIINSNRKLTFF